MDDYTIDTSGDAIDATLREMVEDGLVIERTVIAPDGTQATEYKLTDKGVEQARNLIIRLADTEES